MNRRSIADLFPWYLNGTLGGRERQRVDGHVQECSTCRDELAMERRIYEGMAVEPRVEYMPAPSLKRLQAAISGRGAEHTASRPAVLRTKLQAAIKSQTVKITMSNRAALSNPRMPTTQAYRGEKIVN